MDRHTDSAFERLEIVETGRRRRWSEAAKERIVLESLGQVELLILDDWGLQPLDAQARHDLLEILEDRYGRKSTIVTSQLDVASWHRPIGDATYADAILDRLLHNAHRIELTGDSLRRGKPTVAD